MKIIILTSSEGAEEIKNIGASQLGSLIQLSEVIIYDNYATDFSNVPDLYDGEEKIVLFDPLSHPEDFAGFSKYLGEFKNVKYLFSPYSYYDDLDLNLLEEKGIRYRNNGGANAASVAQYSIMAMYMLLHNYSGINQTLDDSSLGEELGEKSVGIIGMGAVGQEILKTLNKLGLDASFYNRSPKTVNAKQVDLQEIFKKDIIFISVATSQETKSLLKDIEKYTQPHSYIIDISATDELFNKQALIDLVSNKKLKGFAFETEQQEQYKILRGTNIVATPHIAWRTQDAEIRKVKNYLSYALMVLKGEVEKIDFII